MLMLSKKVEYGLISLLHMADLPPGELATAKGLSEQYNMPAELLGKVLQALSRSKLVAAAQGAHGGYCLAGRLESVKLGQVIEALEGPVHFARCQDDPTSCDQFHSCNIKQPVHEIHDQLQGFIYGISLAGFRKPAKKLTEAGL